MNKKSSILLLIKIYLLVLSIFSLFRLMLFISEMNSINFEGIPYSKVLQAFLMGVRFDLVISGYILLLPAFLIFLFDLLKFQNKIVTKLIFFWIFTLFTFSFIISAADIPYFNQFYSRFSIGAFEWIENFSFVFSMIIEEPKYFLIIIPFIILEIIFFILLKQIFNKNKGINISNIYLKGFISLLFLGVMFLGIRGRISKKSPIRVGTAYFSDNSFLNKLGLNPVFTLMRSYIDSKDSKNESVNMMDNKIAIKKAQEYLHISNTKYNSPIARDIEYDSLTAIKPNIVLIIMESMSAAKMNRHGNKKNLTPFLDSLSHKSIYFENLYTSGKHTFNGIFSSLFSFPALYRQHPLKQMKEYNGISSTLLQNGYSTTYFTTHDGQFDNIEGFLRANDFQQIISQKNYPNDEIKTTLGVPDDYMFRFSIPIIDKLTEKKKPFFVTFMTTSDHGPFYIPEYFHPKTSKIKEQITEYADWSLSEFIRLSSKKKWFSNTIFVFVADHGARLDAIYDISLNYHHSPLLFYAPEIFENNITYDKIAAQIDIFPTLMGMIKTPYLNNTLGIDIINKNRPYTLINDDDKIGVLNNEFLLIMKKNETSKLYKYRKGDKTNYYNEKKSLVVEMENYAKANMQVFQYMLNNNKTRIQKD